MNRLLFCLFFVVCLFLKTLFSEDSSLHAIDKSELDKIFKENDKILLYDKQRKPLRIDNADYNQINKVIIMHDIDHADLSALLKLLPCETLVFSGVIRKEHVISFGRSSKLKSLSLASANYDCSIIDLSKYGLEEFFVSDSEDDFFENKFLLPNTLNRLSIHIKSMAGFTTNFVIAPQSKIAVLDLSLSNIQDSDVYALLEYTKRNNIQIKKIDLSGTGITKASVQNLQSLPGVVDINIKNTSLNDEDNLPKIFTPK